MQKVQNAPLECTVAEKRRVFMARNHKNDKRAHLKKKWEKSFLLWNGIVIADFSSFSKSFFQYVCELLLLLLYDKLFFIRKDFLSLFCKTTEILWCRQNIIAFSRRAQKMWNREAVFAAAAQHFDFINEWSITFRII